MALRFRACAALVLATFGVGRVLAQTDVITNGSFESGLTGWTIAPSTANPAAASVTCSFNATTAVGTETLTGTGALPPSSGSSLAMGAIRGNGNGTQGGNSSCVLYQDVTIPEGATIGTLNLTWGLKKLGVSNSSAALAARVYDSTDSIPFYSSSGSLTAGGGIGIIQFPVDSTTLVSATGSANISALAGHTVRVALFIAMTVPASVVPIQIAAGFDQVQLLVTVPTNITTAFGAPSLNIGGSTSLTYTITNPAGSSAVTAVGFTNNLPEGLTVATPNNLTGSCGGGTISAVAGSGTISLSGGSLGAGVSSCTFSVDVTATSGGTKFNSVRVSSSSGNGNVATSSVTVILPIPTLGGWGMIVLALLLVSCAYFALRPREVDPRS